MKVLEVLKTVKEYCENSDCRICPLHNWCNSLYDDGDAPRCWELELAKTRGFYAVDKAPADTKFPVRSTKHSAGYDFFAPKTFTVPAKGLSEIIWTNIKAYMQSDEYLGVYIRSSLAVNKGLMLVNNVGIIDADYYSNPKNDGNIGFRLYNNTDHDVIIEKGERVVQGIFQKYLLADDDNAIGERTGGTGSTGK